MTGVSEETKAMHMKSYEQGVREGTGYCNGHCLNITSAAHLLGIACCIDNTPACAINHVIAP